VQRICAPTATLDDFRMIKVAYIDHGSQLA